MPPSIGQQVLFWDVPPVDETDQPEVAFVCFVHPDSDNVNLFVINGDGHSRAEINVPLRGEGDELTPRNAVAADDVRMEPAATPPPAAAPPTSGGKEKEKDKDKKKDKPRSGTGLGFGRSKDDDK